MERIKTMNFYGAGGHAKVIIESWQLAGGKVTQVFDDNTRITSLSEWPVRKPGASDLAGNTHIVVSIGDNAARKKVAERLKHCTFGTVIHSRAIISGASTISPGSVVMAGVVVNHSARIGHHVILNSGAVVEHDCDIHDFVHIAPNATVCGNVQIGEGSLIGAGAVVLPGIRIGSWCIVGAGAVVVVDVADRTTVAGNPARILKNTKGSL
jgi:sugar O-acyltransferase (sialic acid O-acetyltransferase NeuD family)